MKWLEEEGEVQTMTIVAQQKLQTMLIWYLYCYGQTYRDVFYV